MTTVNKVMAKVYSYMRFSMKRQAKGQSIERQSRYAELWAHERGLTLDTALTMRDEGLSAYHQRHVKNGALGVFLKLIDDGKIESGSVLIVEGLDRLSRAEPMVAQGQLGQIINAGVTVVTAGDNKTYSRESLKANPMDLIYSLLIMIRAHEESETKSDRIKKALSSRCQKFLDSGSCPRIGSGKDPRWVKWNTAKNAFELVETEAAAIRRMVQLHLQGYGPAYIGKTLRNEGLPLASSPRHDSSLIHELVSRAYLLIGMRVMEADGKEYRLSGYYPALISQEEYNEIISRQQQPKSRGRVGGIPSIFTGHNGLFRCGYCGSCLNTARPTANAIRAECNGRNGCRTGSCKLDPLEKAVLSWCSDQMNLNSLVGTDRTADIKARLAAARTSVRELQMLLERVTDAMLSTDSPPAIFAARARKIEDQIATANHAIRVDEAALLAEASTPTVQAAELWASLSTAAMNGDIEARMAVRKLVGETFKSIVLYRHGTTPPPIEETKYQRDKFWDLLLVSKSGVSRQIRVSRAGEVVAFNDANESAAAL